MATNCAWASQRANGRIAMSLGNRQTDDQPSADRKSCFPTNPADLCFVFRQLCKLSPTTASVSQDIPPENGPPLRSTRGPVSSRRVQGREDLRRAEELRSACPGPRTHCLLVFFFFFFSRLENSPCWFAKGKPQGNHPVVMLVCKGETTRKPSILGVSLFWTHAMDTNEPMNGLKVGSASHADVRPLESLHCV